MWRFYFCLVFAWQINAPSQAACTCSHALSFTLFSLSFSLLNCSGATESALLIVVVVGLFYMPMACGCRWRAATKSTTTTTATAQSQTLLPHLCASSFIMPAQLCTQAASVKRLETRTLVALSLLASLYLSLHLSLQLSFAASTPALFGLLHSFGSAVGALIYCLL